MIWSNNLNLSAKQCTFRMLAFISYFLIKACYYVRTNLHKYEIKSRICQVYLIKPHSILSQIIYEVWTKLLIRLRLYDRLFMLHFLIFCSVGAWQYWQYQPFWVVRLFLTAKKVSRYFGVFFDFLWFETKKWIKKTVLSFV